MPCLGFDYGKNSELLQMYENYKQKDTLNESMFIHYKDSVWSTHSSDYTNEALKIETVHILTNTPAKNVLNFHSHN